MPDYELQWEEPPAKAFGGNKVHGKWWDALSPLLEHPGEWARVASGYASRSATMGALRSLKSRKANYPPGQFEFVCADDMIYARYLGPEDA